MYTFIKNSNKNDIQLDAANYWNSYAVDFFGKNVIYVLNDLYYCSFVSCFRVPNSTTDGIVSIKVFRYWYIFISMRRTSWKGHNHSFLYSGKSPGSIPADC